MKQKLLYLKVSKGAKIGQFPSDKQRLQMGLWFQCNAFCAWRLPPRDCIRRYLYPYTKDQLAAVHRSVLQWEFIDDLTRRIDRNALADAVSHVDSVTGYRIVYNAMGLDKAYTDQIISRHRQ